MKKQEVPVSTQLFDAKTEMKELCKSYAYAKHEESAPNIAIAVWDETKLKYKGLLLLFFYAHLLNI